MTRSQALDMYSDDCQSLAMPRNTPATAHSLRQARIARAITQPELATALGITQGALSRIELGTRTPSADLAQRIADHFGVPADHFRWPQEDVRLDEAVQRIVSDFPALTPQQRERVAAALTQTEQVAS